METEVLTAEERRKRFREMDSIELGAIIIAAATRDVNLDVVEAVLQLVVRAQKVEQ
jgi:hypothetical protein